MHFKIKYQQSFFGKLWFIYSQRLLKVLVNKRANFFLKPNDIISSRPTIFAYHEIHIEMLIEDAASVYKDFFLDLGANIGLTSCLVGKHFSRVDCVEPNELVFNILKTNVAMHLSNVKYHCHMVGLGKEDELLKLLVPQNNFGGAFIEENNELTSRKLHEKSSIDGIDNKNHIETQITVKKAETWLKSYFEEMRQNKHFAGIVKIDVEGYEEIIFESIVKCLPKDISVVVIMENWFDRFPTNQFTSKTHRTEWFYFKKKKRYLHSIPFKLLGLSSSYSHELAPLTEKTNSPHDVICIMSGT